MTPATFRLILPTSELVNLNAERSMHPKARARLVKPIREATRDLAAGHEQITGRVIIAARFQWADARIRDSSNWAPTVKAMVDGLVDAGVLPGDDDRYIDDTRCGVTLPPQRGLKGYVRIVLTVEGVG